jgi:pyruvate/2-oxoglutarate dehydrogenase complex dihydrolipoamide dehydrogenase (E3) component
MTLSDGGEVCGEEVLVAAGRRPRTRDLGLETVGLPPGQPVQVTGSLAVPGLPWLFAIGDVTGRSLLTHMGKYQAHVLSEILDGHPGEVRGDDAAAPRVIFTDPQVADVGLTGPSWRRARRSPGSPASTTRRSTSTSTASSRSCGARNSADSPPGTHLSCLSLTRFVMNGEPP